MSRGMPSWDDLHEVANGQSGHFTAQQAAEAGFSAQLLHKHVQNKNLEHAARSIYRITRFPPSENEDLVVLWLWSDREAVFSHETALQLHGLSDALPARVHMTVPTTTSRRRKSPAGAVLHFADIPEGDTQWLGPVQITKPARSILDVATAHGDAALVAQAIDEGIRAGLFTFEQVALAGRYVADAQGWGTPIRPNREGVLGDRFYAQRLGGTCTTPPQADWPTLARKIATEFGATLRVSQYLPSRTMQLEVVWPLSDAPDERRASRLRKRLAKRFSWA
jgi:hypothetical protein